MAGKPRAITSLSDYTESLNILLYGDSGSGKTVLAGTADENTATSRALFLAAEPGTISAARQGSTADVWPIDAHAELMKAHRYLEENPQDYAWVLLDGLTHMQEILWRESLDKAININPDRDPDILAQQDYLRVQNQLKEIVRLFNDLPQNVIYTAQTMRSEDEEDEVLYLPLLSGKKGEFAQKICGMCHVVAYLSVVTPKSGAEPYRRLYTQREGKIFAKDRYDAIGRMDKPTVPRIYRKVYDSSTSKPGTTTITTPPAKKAAPRKRAAARRSST